MNRQTILRKVFCCTLGKRAVARGHAVAGAAPEPQSTPPALPRSTVGIGGGGENCFIVGGGGNCFIVH